MVERSDEYIIGRLIERSRLLIALSEEIPVETKLQTQPLLKQLEQALAVPPEEQDEERVRGDLRRALRRARRLRRPRRAPLGAPELRALSVSALAGVRVLDLTRFLAGPFCTSILADLGAEVIKVEAPGAGDEGRYGYPTADGVPVVFLALNRNKKGITLDLRQPEGPALLRRFLPHVDVLVENFAGGTLARWGLAPGGPRRASIRASSSPACRASGRRARGRSRPSYDIVTQAASGLMSLTGFPETPPTRGGGSLGDYMQGLFGAIGVLAAL